MSKLLPLTNLSATLLLAYCQHYTCKYLPGRCLTNSHLGQLAAWLNCPSDKLRSLRQNRTLAVHVTLLQAAGLLNHTQNQWYLTPSVYAWLDQSPSAQYATLLEAITACHWTAVIDQYQLADTLTIDVMAFIQQQLHRQAQQTPPPPPKAQWLPDTPEGWQLCLPLTMPLKALFHLLQLGSWCPDQPLVITPLTIAQALHHGYSLSHITACLETATGQILTAVQQQQLLDWFHRHDAYQLQTVSLLATKQPQQLAAIIRNGHLRPHIHEQISPRHAIVSPALQALLQRWGVRHNYHIQAPQSPPAPSDLTCSEYQWLGLQVLTALGQLIPLPYPAPHAEAESLAAHIPPAKQAHLTAVADQLIASLQAAIKGRDAFFPAAESPPAHWLDLINHALGQETALSITYQALGDRKATGRTIQPLHLDKRGCLFYLYAYCYRAESNLTFRLDRVHSLEPGLS